MTFFLSKTVSIKPLGPKKPGQVTSIWAGGLQDRKPVGIVAGRNVALCPTSAQTRRIRDSDPYAVRLEPASRIDRWRRREVPRL
jgi:hypothetical protein